MLIVLAGAHFTYGQNLTQIDFEDVLPTIPEIKYEACSSKSNFGVQRIFQGSAVTTHSWPWIVHLDVFYGSRPGLCSGTIIGENHIVTAAHCCRLRENVGTVSKIVATFGRLKNSERNTNIEFSMTIEKENIFPHEEYRKYPMQGAGKHDVCVLKTPENIMAARPRECVAKNCAMVACTVQADMEELVGKNCWVAGWGKHDEYSGLSDNLMETGVNIFSQEYCLQKSTARTKKRLRSDEICAGTPDGDNNGLSDAGPDTCKADSGGPLMCRLGSQKTPFLVGITSWGDGCGKEGSPGVYSSISEHYEFIENKVLTTTTTTCATPDSLQIDLDGTMIDMTRDKKRKTSCSMRSYINDPILYTGNKNRVQYYLFKHTPSSPFTLFRTGSRTRFSCTRQFEILAESDDTKCIESDLSWYTLQVPDSFRMKPGENSQKLGDYQRTSTICTVTF